MNRVHAAIIGATGFSGVELIHLLARHPGVELAVLSSDQRAGKTVRSVIGSLDAGGEIDRTVGALPFVGRDEARRQIAELRARAGATLFLATPADVSREWTMLAKELGLSVVDLSGAYRLEDAGEAVHHYGAAVAPEIYGLPELFRERIRGAKVISNPGCYATATALALAPLVRESCIEPDSIVVNAVSGVTGAGRKATEEFSFTAIDSDVRAYRILGHQHEPEIAQTLSMVAGKKNAVSLVFTPHLVPLSRGILATSVARLRSGITASHVGEAFARAYAQEPMVDVAQNAADVRITDVVGTNRCSVGFSLDEKRGRIVVTSAIDNLIKGAAGQAVQNFNLMQGFDETTALASLRRFQS